MKKNLRELLDELKTDEIMEAALSSADARIKPSGRAGLTSAMIEPIRRRRYGGPWNICERCGCPIWDKDDVHSPEDCLVYSVIGS